MTELFLILVIIVLGVLLIWEKNCNHAEQDKLINAIIAKNAGDMASLEFVKKVKPEKAPVIEPMTATADLSDEEFEKHIEETLKNG